MWGCECECELRVGFLKNRYYREDSIPYVFYASGRSYVYKRPNVQQRIWIEKVEKWKSGKVEKWKSGKVAVLRIAMTSELLPSIPKTKYWEYMSQIDTRRVIAIRA